MDLSLSLKRKIVQLSEQKYVNQKNIQIQSPSETTPKKNHKKKKVTQKQSQPYTITQTDVEVSTPRKITMYDASEVYKKIKNHPGWDNSDFIVGYEDRFTGLDEVDFNAFRQDFNLESIPFHRVRFYKFQGEVIWSKKDGIFTVPT